MNVNRIEVMQKTHLVKKNDPKSHNGTYELAVYGPISTAQVAEWKALPGFNKVFVRPTPHSKVSVVLITDELSDEEVLSYALLESLR